MKKIISKKTIILFFVISFIYLLNLLVISSKAYSWTGNTLGEQKTLVAMFNFPDALEEPFTIAQMKKVMETNTDSVNNRIRENSYEKTWLKVDYVAGWHTLPHTRDYYDHAGGIFEDSIITIDPFVNDFQDGSTLVFIYAGDYFSGGHAFSGVWESPRFGTFKADVVYVDTKALGAITHEFGHTLGFRGAKAVEYTNPYGIPDNLLDPTQSMSGSGGDMHDIMGYTRHEYFSSIWKVKAKWIDESQILDFIPGATLYNIEQIELPSTRKKLMRIPLGIDLYGNQYYYWLEYRINYDTVQIRADPIQYYSPYYAAETATTAGRCSL